MHNWTLRTLIWEKFRNSYSYKTCKAMAFTCLGIAGLLHVRARQCTSTPRLQNGCIFGSQDA